MYISAEKEFRGEVTPGDLAMWCCPCSLWGLVFPVQTPGVLEQSPEQRLMSNCSFHLRLHAFGSRPSGVHFSKAWPVTTTQSDPTSWTALRTGDRHPSIQDCSCFILHFPPLGSEDRVPVSLWVTGDTSFRWKPYPVRQLGRVNGRKKKPQKNKEKYKFAFTT